MKLCTAVQEGCGYMDTARIATLLRWQNNSLCALLISRLTYNTRWANSQVSSSAFTNSSPGILYLDAICNTFIIYNLCSDGQLCTVNVLQQSTLFVTVHYLHFLEKWALFFVRETGSHIDTFFVLTPICLMRDHSNIYSLSVIHVVCGTWSLFTFRAPLPINSLEVITIFFFRYFLLYLISLLTLSAKSY